MGPHALAYAECSMPRFSQAGTGKWRLSSSTAAALAAGIGAVVAPLAAIASPMPVALSALQSFKGSVTYTAHPADDPSRTIEGDLSLASGRFTLEERSGSTVLHMSDAQSWLQAGGRKMYFNDPLAASALANPWAVMLAACATLPMGEDPTGHSWTLGDEMRVYLDGQEGGRIAGLVDLSPGADVSFSFAGWEDVQGMWLPANVVRFRDGIVDASFVIDDYRVVWASSVRAASADRWQAPTQVVQDDLGSNAANPGSGGVWRSFNVLFLLLAGALAVAAWLRRDALTGQLCRRLAGDPRAWRDEGTTVFVSPEGVLWFDGRRYRVGSAFFNRRAHLQSSLFFIRISAPDAGLPVVLARKFPLRDAPRVPRKAAGFTLIEALVATALFAAVIVAAVFPTLVVLAHADRVAALHEAAVQVAANALVDEEDALAYGTSSISGGSATSRVDGLDLTVSVAPSSVKGMQLVTVAVDDSTGAPLARIATMIGPPVPPPDDQPAPPGTR